MACMSCNQQAREAKYCTSYGADLTAHHIACPNEACDYSYNGTVARINYCPRCGSAFPPRE